MAGTRHVSGFYLLVPDATKLNGIEGQAPEFPAPAAQAWAAVAELFRMGIENMHPMHQQAIVAGLLLGLAITALEMSAPEKFRRYCPAERPSASVSSCRSSTLCRCSSVPSSQPS